MKKQSSFLILLFCSLMPAFPAKTTIISWKITGIVRNAETRRPISNAYTFIVEGEEESLTNAKGEFEFISWQKLPSMLKVRHPNYKESELKIQELPRVLLIELHEK